MPKQITVIASLPHGLEESGAKELENLGAKLIKFSTGIVICSVDLSCFYRLHLQARLPFRFFRQLSQFKCHSQKSLYDGIQNSFDLENWLDPTKSFRVDVSGVSREMNHSHFTALQIKNAIVDSQREIWGYRSNVNLTLPDVCLHLHLNSNIATLSLATSSYSLHRRGYRSAIGKAPLKENIASGLLYIAKWKYSINIVDLFCGSGTFLLEAASIAKGICPGLNSKFMFEDWPDFDEELWDYEKKSAHSLFKSNQKISQIIGFEKDINIANQAKMNILKAGLEKEIVIKMGDFRDYQLPKVPGIIVCNPPYGKRIGNTEDLGDLYFELGHYLKKNASGWNLWLLNGNPQLSRFLRMKCKQRFPISNGGIDCRWMNYLIH